MALKRTPVSLVYPGGLSKTRLARMHDVMASHVDRGEAPGLVTLVSRRGEVHAEAIGTMTPEGGRPMARDTIFRISSMTKPITAVATLILVEECELRLDESVGRLLPELGDPRVLKRPDAALEDTVPASRPITVRDLLTFTMGTGMVLAPPGAYPIQNAMADAMGAPGPPSPSAFPPPDEWMRRLGALPLVYQPGERGMYNTGAEVLGFCPLHYPSNACPDVRES
jgi:CubicO group peptidase (beta-lactamase class C family)